jgi:rubrerythrin
MRDFYLNAAKRVDDSDIKKTFSSLAKVEQEHKDLVAQLKNLVQIKS